MTGTTEKRRSARVPSDIRLRSHAPREVVEMEAVNLSLGGAYCTSRRRFEPMTRLEVHLDLPGRTPVSATITAQAVVVRVEPGPAGGDGRRCRLALLFQEMADADRARLRRFLGQDGD